MKRDLTGQWFGSWFVIGRDDDKKAKKTTFWRVRCLCGTERSHGTTMLTLHRSKQCRKCAAKAKENEDGVLTATIWGRVVQGARQRGIELGVDQDYCWRLYLAQDGKCRLSGLPITFVGRVQDVMHGGMTASLDKVDSSGGYVEGNVQWVHKDVNRMKQYFSNSYFIQICGLVASTPRRPLLIDDAPSDKKQLRRKPRLRTKLSDDEVARIRQEHADGSKQKDLADKFDTTPGNISLIVNKRSRRNVPEPSPATAE